jgi:predicted S18 family serine protease
MRLDRRILALLTVLMVTMASAGAAYAQGTTSRVTGQVTDTSGGRIPARRSR